MSLLPLEIQELSVTNSKNQFFETKDNYFYAEYLYKNQACFAAEFADIRKSTNFSCLITINSKLDTFENIIVDYKNELDIFTFAQSNPYILNKKWFNFIEVDIQNELANINCVADYNNITVIEDDTRFGSYYACISSDRKDSNMFSSIEQITSFNSFEQLAIKSISNFTKAPTLVDYCKLINVYRNIKLELI